MRIVALADLHNNKPEVPDGDVLVVAGDLTWEGRLEQVREVADWFKTLPHKHKVVIAGNHDFCFDRASKRGTQCDDAVKLLQNAGCTYLLDSGCEIDGKKFYGSPWQPWFHNWAFNVQRGGLYVHWNKIPADLDVLIVHGPPYGFGDTTSEGDRVGCSELRHSLEQKKPKHVFFGHIHEDWGQWTMNGGITNLYNCSVGPIHSWRNTRDEGKPVVLDI